MHLELAYKILKDLNKSKLQSLKNDLIRYAVEYSRIRVEWYFATDERKDEIEDLRRITHDTFIESCDILSLEMSKVREDTDWRSCLVMTEL